MSIPWKEIFTLGIPMAMRGIPMAMRGIRSLIASRKARKAAEKAAKEKAISDAADIRGAQLAAAKSARIQVIKNKLNRRTSKW